VFGHGGGHQGSETGSSSSSARYYESTKRFHPALNAFFFSFPLIFSWDGSVGSVSGSGWDEQGSSSGSISGDGTDGTDVGTSSGSITQSMKEFHLLFLLGNPAILMFRLINVASFSLCLIFSFLEVARLFRRSVSEDGSNPLGGGEAPGWIEGSISDKGVYQLKLLNSFSTQVSPFSLP